jgi:hypothetical protein
MTTKRKIIHTGVALLGIFLEVINGLLVIKFENYFEIGIRLAGAFILFISIFLNIGLAYFLESE